MSTTIVRQYVGYDGLSRCSIRLRSDGIFQIYRDGGYLEDGTQPYWMEDEPISGLFGDLKAAEEEVSRSPMQWRPVEPDGK